MGKQIVEFGFNLYIMNAVSVCLHEMGHLFVAFIVKAKVKHICIGSKKYAISIGTQPIFPHIINERYVIGRRVYGTV